MITNKKKINENEWDLIISSDDTKLRYWSDILLYKDLFFIFCWRDFSVRYKQTVIGVLWALIRPFLIMIVFTIVFGGIAKLPTEGLAPYAIMVYAATLPWQFFASSLDVSSNSLVGNSDLVSKVYFPRIIIPTSSMLVGVVDFLISLIVLAILMVYYGFYPDYKILFLPFFFIIAFLTALGFGLFFTALNVKYRDFRYIIPFMVQFGLYISPVGFSSSVIPEEFQLIYSLNPMVGVIDGFRWCILGGEATLNISGFLISLIIMFLFLVLGVRTFRRLEKTFADMM